MKKKIIVGIVLAIISISLFFSETYKNDSDSIVNSGETSSAAVQTAQKNDPTSEEMTSSNDKNIVIDVGGAVKNPGIVIIPLESRVYNAVESAGGLKAEADTSTINLAAILNDGEKVYIPERGKTISQTPGVSSSGLININTADSVTLQRITGVGPSTANKIIDHRKLFGLFKKIEDLKNVSGIGDKTFDKFKSQICIN